MDKSSRRAAVAALIILLAFGFGAYFMPSVMMALGTLSPVAAGIAAIIFVGAFFGIFWLRARTQRSDE